MLTEMSPFQTVLTAFPENDHLWCVLRFYGFSFVVFAVSAFLAHSLCVLVYVCVYLSYSKHSLYNEVLRTENWLCYKRYFVNSGAGLLLMHCSGDRETLRIKSETSNKATSLYRGFTVIVFSIVHVVYCSTSVVTIRFSCKTIPPYVMPLGP